MSFKSRLSSRVALLALLFHSEAFAQQKTFDLKSGNALKTIPEFARQAGIQILAPAEELRTVVMPALKGTFDVHDALKRLLRNTSLEIMSDTGGVIRLRAVEKTAENIRGTNPAAREISITAAPKRVPQSAQEIQPAEEVLVTGSRIVREGYSAPTPVTTANRDEIQAAVTPALGEFLGSLPAFGTAKTSRNSFYSISGGDAGSSLVNLRQLGINRTLVLFDRRRVVNQNLAGGVDLNLIPDSLVQRVDIVTGGASAAWGSDALAGVVNVIVNKEFRGLEAKIELGLSDYGDGFTHKEDIAGGATFAGGKGSVIASFTHADTPHYATGRPWYSDHLNALFPNPAYVPGGIEPKMVLLPNAGYFNGTRGGLITTGPLKNTQFVGNGQPAPYVVYASAGAIASGPDAAQGVALHHPLLNPTRRYNFYSDASYSLSDDISAKIEFNYGEVSASLISTNYTRLNNITVRSDNAFLPPTIKAAMAANGIASFGYGTTNENLGFVGTEVNRKLWRGVLGLSGNIFNEWVWDAYYAHGKVRSYGHLFGDPYTPNYNRAIDAVFDPANGQIVCRSSLTNPRDGCSPLNLFGIDVVSEAAKDYVQGYRPIQLMKTKLDVAAATISGSPGSSWAGPIDVAAGLEARWDAANVWVDALSPAREFYSGNFSPLAPVVVKVREGFLEANVPLAKREAWARSLDVNAALRVTDYSTSGVVVTWKGGLGYQVTDQLRLRLTRSRDIRAPSLNDLYSPGRYNNGVVFDAVNSTNNNVIQLTGSNPKLSPELGDTWTGGAVYSSMWLDGFQASIDYFDIQVTDAIVAPTRDTVLNGCLAGNAFYCAFTHRDPNGILIQYDLIPANVAKAHTRGLDFEASYRTAVGPGEAAFRVIGTYLMELSTLNNGVYVDNAGSVSTNTPDGNEGVPKLKILGKLDYSWAAFTLGLQARYLGRAKNNTYWTSADVKDEVNNIPAIVHLNLRAAYDFKALGSDTRLYVAVDNLLDRDPPRVAPTTLTAGSYNLGTSIGNYDPVGRYFKVGIRARY